MKGSSVIFRGIPHEDQDRRRRGDTQPARRWSFPLLRGARMRLVLGPLADHIGAKKTALIGMAKTLVPLLMGWLRADSYPEVLLVGLLPGVAGANNVGSALATFFGPWVASSPGWHAPFGIALATLALVALLAE